MAGETVVNKLTGTDQDTQVQRPVRIFIADEEVAFCKNLRRVLQPQRRIEIIGSAHDVESLLKLTEAQRPHVLLIDYRIWRKLEVPGGHRVAGPIELIMLDTPDKTEIIESFRLGARGVILKKSQARIWWKGIGAVLAGQYWLGNESLAVLIQAIRDSPLHSDKTVTSRHFGLTPREIEIVQKIADGRTNKEVGEDCAIRERTVKHHLTNIFGKIGVSSRLELALFARDHQMTGNLGQSRTGDRVAIPVRRGKPYSRAGSPPSAANAKESQDA